MALFSSVYAVKNLKNIKSKMAEIPMGNFEYKNFQAYKDAGGTAETLDKWTREDGRWLKSDRESCNQFWKNAVISIIKKPVAMRGRISPFEQVSDFYHYTQVLVNFRKHETQWLFGAYYLVSDLADAYDRGATIDMLRRISPTFYDNFLAFDNLKELLKKLNIEIANYAISQFFRLLYGEYRFSPREGKDAWKFDKQFIISEQNPTAYPVYDDEIYSEGIKMENDIFNKRGIFISYDALGIGNFIPVYSDQYNSILTEDTSAHPRYGQEARILVPLAMLYPNIYFFTDDEDPIDNSFAIKDTKFAKTLELGSRAESKGRNKTIFKDYSDVNKNLKKVFYDKK